MRMCLHLPEGDPRVQLLLGGPLLKQGGVLGGIFDGFAATSTRENKV